MNALSGNVLGAIRSFLGLRDTPSAWGLGGVYPRINDAGDALTFISEIRFDQSTGKLIIGYSGPITTEFIGDIRLIPGFIEMLATAGPASPLGQGIQAWAKTVVSGQADVRLRREDGVEGRILNVSTEVFHSAAQSIPSGVYTPLNFDSEVNDDEGWHNPALNNQRITVHEAGVYQAQLQNCRFSGNTSNYREARIRDQAGNTWNYSPTIWPAGTAAVSVPVTATRSLPAGGYVYAEVFQNSTVALNILAFAKLTLVKIK